MDVKKNTLWLVLIGLLLFWVGHTHFKSSQQSKRLNKIIESVQIDYSNQVDSLLSRQLKYKDTVKLQRKKADNLIEKILDLTQKSQVIKTQKNEAVNNINGFAEYKLDSILSNFRLTDSPKKRNSNRAN